MTDVKRDFWDKVDVLLKPMGSIIAAILVAGMGVYSRDYLVQRQGVDNAALAERQQTDNNARLYAQLVSNREKAESDLRADMFGRIIETFLAPNGGDGRDVLHLEILAYNFHEALDLGPLFKAVSQNIQKHRAPFAAVEGEVQSDEDKQKSEEFDGFLDRLERVARDVNSKQIAALEGHDNVRDAWVYFDDVDPDIVEIIARERIGDHHFQLEILDVYEAEKELEVKLTIWAPIYDDKGIVTRWDLPTGPIFRLGFFDFPMIDNTRLSGGYRCAVVLKKFENGSAKVAFVYFPGSRASLKEKRYYDEILDDLGRTYGKNKKENEDEAS
jgi:hypothetical protein